MRIDQCNMTLPYPPFHDAVVTPGKRAPLAVQEVATAAPGPGEVVVHVLWTCSSPLNMHQADGGLPVNHPFILGDTCAGIVVATGPQDAAATKSHSAPIEAGDKVMGFVWERQHQAGFQTHVTVPRHLLSRIPSNISLEEAATVPSSLVTAMHTIATELQLELPWPRPSDWEPKGAREPFLVWGAASSVGLYVVQVLNHWGYKNILAVASQHHHPQLLKYGAAKCFDYKQTDITDQIKKFATKIPHVIDCIGHVEGTLRPLAKIASAGTKGAIMLPLIVRDSTVEVEPELAVDPSSVLKDEWSDGVELIGVRTFFYEKNSFFKWHLQPDIVPSLLESGAIQPSKIRVVEGSTMIERAQRALDLLRERAPSGERLVWRVSE